MIVLGGYLIAPEAKRTQFPVVSDPDEEEVLAALSKLRHSSGVLVLRVKRNLRLALMKWRFMQRVDDL